MSQTPENLANDRGLELTGLTPEVANGFLLIVLPELRNLLKDMCNVRAFTRERIVRQIDIRFTVSPGNRLNSTYYGLHSHLGVVEEEPSIIKL